MERVWPDEMPPVRYDGARKNVLIDRYWDEGLSLSEAQELFSYIQQDIERVRGTGGSRDILGILYRFRAMLRGYILDIAR